MSFQVVVSRNSLDIHLDTFTEYRHIVSYSSHMYKYYTYERFSADIMCSRDVILELRPHCWKLSAQVRLAVKRAGCARICRGRRAGKHVQARRNDVAYSETSDREIPVVLTSRRRRHVNSSVHVARRDVVLRRIATTTTTVNVTHCLQSSRRHTTVHRQLPIVTVRHQRRRSNETAHRRTTVRRPQQLLRRHCGSH